MKSFFCHSESDRKALAARLKKFYDTTSDYLAFQNPSHHEQPWSLIAQDVRARVHDGAEKVRILEVGAGRSGLARYLEGEDLRHKVFMHAQDVTSANQDWLKGQFDETTIGELSVLKGDFDLILSTYVFEHTVNPQVFLEQLWRHTAPRGAIYLTCPRYDMPLYLPRAVDHLPLIQRAKLSAYSLFRRILTIITGRPAWLVQADPAVFYLPFQRDRDAVHWASWWDVRAIYPSAQRLKFRADGWREWIRLRLLTVICRIDKNN